MSTTTIIIAVALALLVSYVIRKSRALSPEQRREILGAIERGATFVDVRTRQEFSAHHPKGAVNIPLHELSGQIDRLQKKPAPVVVCCASGARSARAAKLLRRAGVETLDLGGRANWPS